tara:strand:+ start:251 stop:478 length:228 start_codon:yes stop_codon:yes gene_type:complete
MLRFCPYCLAAETKQLREKTMKNPMTNKYLSLIISEDAPTVQMLESMYEAYQLEYVDLDDEELFEYVLNDAGYLY